MSKLLMVKVMTSFTPTLSPELQPPVRQQMFCYGVESVSCSGTAQASSSSTPASTVSYQVRGATLSLRLPDGRVAVVNCDSRLPPAGAVIAVALLGGKAMKPSNCSVPLVSQIKAEFSGNRAKLKWPVSIDGKKLESETYRILGVLEKP